MKSFFGKTLRKFLQYRDWLVVVIIAGGILYFMQQMQAVQSQNSEDLWKNQWGDVIRVPPAPTDLGPAEGESSLSGPANDMRDSFPPLKLEEISALSYNQIFTEAKQYQEQLNRLKQLRKDFQDAQDKGDIATAIDRLKKYVESDPLGTRLSESWTTEPKTMLRNLVCNELVRTVDSALETANETQREARELASTDPYKALEVAQKSLSGVERCLQEVESNPDCKNDPRLAENDRLNRLVSLREQTRQERESLNQRLIRQEYDGILQQANALGAEAEVEHVAETMVAIQEFRNLLKRQGEGVLTEPQVQRLDEIEKKFEANKVSLIAKVQQRIEALGSDPEATANLEKIREIIKQYGYLKLLGESEAKIAQQRRKWESHESDLEASGAVEEVKSLLGKARSEIAQIDALIDAGSDIAESASKINGYIEQIELIMKNNRTTMRKVDSFQKVNNDFRDLRKDFIAKTRRK